MPLFAITFDERKRTHNYKPLYDQLNTWGAAHLQNSVWLVNLNARAGQVRDALFSHMHSDDTVCVIELEQGSSWSAQNVRQTGSDWLTAYVQRY